MPLITKKDELPIQTEDFTGQFIKKNRDKIRGKYLYILTKDKLEPIEQAIKWYYAINNIDNKNLFLSRHTYEHLKKVEHEIEHCLIKYHQFPLGTIQEWRMFEEERQEELANIRKQKGIEMMNRPGFCESCNLFYSMCECE